MVDFGVPYKDRSEKQRYQREWRAARRDEWIESKGGKCTQCGSTVELQVDHIDPSQKTMNPTYVWSKNEITRTAELANCQVLCKTCHDTKTGHGTKPHGTLGRYRQKCRCAECRSANAAKGRELRAAKKSREDY